MCLLHVCTQDDLLWNVKNIFPAHVVVAHRGKKIAVMRLDGILVPFSKKRELRLE